LRGLERHIPEFRARGIAVVAISVDSNADSRKLCQSEGYTFPLLSDPKTEVIRRYGVLHRGAGEDGRDIARPAEFVVDSVGTVRWVNLTGDIRVRARPEEVLREIDRLQLGVNTNRSMAILALRSMRMGSL
jgi:peroxiredoxin